MRLALIGLVGSAALIAACSPKPADTNAAANATPAAPAANAAPAMAAAAGPAGMPAPAAGLWKRVSVQDGAAPDTSNKCLDGKPINPTEGGPPCSQMNVSAAAGGGVVVDADCPGGGTDAKLHMTFQGDYKTRFSTDSTMTMSSRGQAPMTMHNHSDYTYVGACPAG